MNLKTRIRTLSALSLLGLLAGCSKPHQHSLAGPAGPAALVAPVASAAATRIANANPSPPIELFDGRLLDGKTSLPGPSLADLPTVEEEVGKRAGEPYLQRRLGPDARPNKENFEVRMGLEGSFTRAGSRQKAYFYRLSLLNGLVVVEDGKIVAHFVGSPGDYALYTNVTPVDVNLDGLTDLLLSRNVEDNQNIYAYLFLAGPEGFKFSGETSVFESNVQAGEEPPKDGALASAYVAWVNPGAVPTFQRETYQRKGQEPWRLSSPRADFNLAQPYAKGDEPELVDLLEQEVAVDPARQTQIQRVQAALDRLSRYDDVPSFIDTAQPRNEGERIVVSDPELRLMELLDTRAAVYAAENATKQEIDRNQASKYGLSLQGLRSPEEIRLAYMKRTTESLGGESPYTQGLTEGQP